MNIGATIYLARKLAGLSQANLAEEIYVSQSVLSRYESGDRNPPFEVIERISESTSTIISCTAGIWSVRMMKGMN